MEDLQRRRPWAQRTDLSASFGRCGSDRRWPPRRSLLLTSVRTRHASGRRAIARPLARLAARRLVAEPDAAPRRRSTCRIRNGFFCTSCPGGPGATSRSSSRRKKIGCRRTIIRRNPPRASHRAPARPTSAWRCWRTWPPATSAIAAPAGCSIAFSKTFATLTRMERHRGHFYNWYDTRSLKPLFPLYVSTVDSGNLAGHLLVLRSGLLELIETKIAAAHASSTVCATRLASCWTWPADFTGRNRKAARRWSAPRCCTRSSDWKKIWSIDPTR